MIDGRGDGLGVAAWLLVRSCDTEVPAVAVRVVDSDVDSCAVGEDACNKDAVCDGPPVAEFAALTARESEVTGLREADVLLDDVGEFDAAGVDEAG
jgi:hypothetical protein